MKTTINKNLLEITSEQADLIVLSQRIDEEAEYIGYILMTLDTDGIRQDGVLLQALGQASRELQENAQELQRAAANILTACEQIRSQASALTAPDKLPGAAADNRP